MSNAIGNLSVGGGSSSALNSGVAVYDVTKYGANPSVNDSLRTAIRNILAIATPGAAITIYIPAGSYTIFDTIVLPTQNVAVIGESMTTTSIFAFGLPAFIVGMPTEFGNRAISSGHWPSMPSQIDSGWGSTRNAFAMYDPATGLTNPDLRYMYFQATTLTQGLANDFWTATNKFTLEFAVSCRTAGSAPGASPVGPGLPPLGFGCITPNPTNANLPRPWSFYTMGVTGTVTASASNSVTFAENTSVISINGGNVPVGALVQITTGTSAGQINQVTGISFAGGHFTYTLTNVVGTTNWALAPSVGDTITVLAGFELIMNVAETQIYDGQIPGYDPSVDGAKYAPGFMFPTGMGAQLAAMSSTNSLWRFKFQLDLTASSSANFAQGWVSTAGSAASNFAAMTTVNIPSLPLINPHFVEASFSCFILGAAMSPPKT